MHDTTTATLEDLEAAMAQLEVFGIDVRWGHEMDPGRLVDLTWFLDDNTYLAEFNPAERLDYLVDCADRVLQTVLMGNAAAEQTPWWVYPADDESGACAYVGWHHSDGPAPAHV
ncbi:hypothetical protein [Georgenia sp. AZ-5]|uniref:hypothetical protein n=1 Tax=Georgenia sp. AZ-5 TaxID=3367526 RepID=UPI003754F342